MTKMLILSCRPTSALLRSRSALQGNTLSKVMNSFMFPWKYAPAEPAWRSIDAAKFSSHEQEVNCVVSEEHVLDKSIAHMLSIPTTAPQSKKEESFQHTQRYRHRDKVLSLFQVFLLPAVVLLKRCPFPSPRDFFPVAVSPRDSRC